MSSSKPDKRPLNVTRLIAQVRAKIEERTRKPELRRTSFYPGDKSGFHSVQDLTKVFEHFQVLLPAADINTIYNYPEFKLNEKSFNWPVFVNALYPPVEHYFFSSKDGRLLNEPQFREIELKQPESNNTNNNTHAFSQAQTISSNTNKQTQQDATTQLNATNETITVANNSKTNANANHFSNTQTTEASTINSSTSKASKSSNKSKQSNKPDFVSLHSKPKFKVPRSGNNLNKPGSFTRELLKPRYMQSHKLLSYSMGHAHCHGNNNLADLRR